ncbi:Tat pathway signal sequence domain protein [Streptomyces humidus]|uniref:Tat pathway signal sequence domain protein n=1 Tax=Streptomyces humidus TaxID=52259 RepID=UPI00332545E2
MNAIGPVEPGEGTQDHPLTNPGTPGILATTAAARPLTRLYAAHRRAVHTLLAAVLLLAGGGYLYAARPPATPPTTAELPYPAQTVDVSYLGEVNVPPGTRPRTFAFEVLLGVQSGPAVTVTRVTQPYDGLSLTSAPRAPFRTESGAARKIVVTMHVTECGKVPRDAGLPFMDVTLRNARAIQVQSFILGPRYAHDLSRALQVACSNDFP